MNSDLSLPGRFYPPALMSNQGTEDPHEHLRTKKVTKWIAVYKTGLGDPPTYYSRLFNTKEETQEDSRITPNDGIFSIEMEVPID